MEAKPEKANRKNELRIALLTISFILVLCWPALGDTATDVKDILEKKLDAVLQVLRQENITPVEKEERIVGIVKPIFNFPILARLALGKHWQGVPDDKQEKFIELFTKCIESFYFDKLIRYTNEEVLYESPIQINQNKVLIPTVLISKDNKIPMVYKFYKSKDNWQIYDIEIKGVSIVVSYRSQFDYLLRNGTFDDLMLKLENKEEL